jgi:hypothetical protein
MAIITDTPVPPEVIEEIVASEGFVAGADGDALILSGKQFACGGSIRIAT